MYCSCVIMCTNSCALLFNAVVEGLKLMHAGVRQILLHVVHFVFYVFLVCVAVFRDASSMFNTESHVFVVLAIPFLLPVLYFQKKMEILVPNASLKVCFMDFLLLLYKIFARIGFVLHWNLCLIRCNIFVIFSDCNCKLYRSARLHLLLCACPLAVC